MASDGAVPTNVPFMCGCIELKRGCGSHDEVKQPVKNDNNIAEAAAAACRFYFRPPTPLQKAAY
jgi:hypothetical protein